MVLNVFMGPNTRLHKAMGFLAAVLGVLWFIEVLSELLVLEGAYLGGSGYVSLFFGLLMVGGQRICSSSSHLRPIVTHLS